MIHRRNTVGLTNVRYALLRLLYFDELRLLFCLPKPFIYKSLRIFTLLSTSPPPLSEWLEKKQRNDSSYQRRYALFKIAYRWAEITFLSSKVIDVKDVKHIKITQHSPHPPPPLLPLRMTRIEATEWQFYLNKNQGAACTCLSHS